VICWLKQTRWALIGIVLACLVTDARALDPNRLPSQYVRGQWTTETGFPGGAVNGIAQTADGYLWIGTDRGLIRFDGFNFGPVSFAPVATASNVAIEHCLRTPAEDCGSVHRGPISYGEKIASLRASHTAYPQSPPCQKITTAEYWFRTSSRALFVSRQTTLRNWDPLHPQ